MQITASTLSSLYSAASTSTSSVRKTSFSDTLETLSQGTSDTVTILQAAKNSAKSWVNDLAPVRGSSKNVVRHPLLSIRIGKQTADQFGYEPENP